MYTNTVPHSQDRPLPNTLQPAAQHGAAAAIGRTARPQDIPALQRDLTLTNSISDCLRTIASMRLSILRPGEPRLATRPEMSLANQRKQLVNVIANYSFELNALGVVERQALCGEIALDHYLRQGQHHGHAEVGQLEINLIFMGLAKRYHPAALHHFLIMCSTLEMPAGSNVQHYPFIMVNATPRIPGFQVDGAGVFEAAAISARICDDPQGHVIIDPSARLPLVRFDDCASDLDIMCRFEGMMVDDSGQPRPISAVGIVEAARPNGPPMGLPLPALSVRDVDEFAHRESAHAPASKGLPPFTQILPRNYFFSSAVAAAAAAAAAAHQAAAPLPSSVHPPHAGLRMQHQQSSEGLALRLVDTGEGHDNRPGSSTKSA